MSEQTNDLDAVLAVILGSCLEAFCEDCDMVLASGTKVYHNMVSTVAYYHGEQYDHDVHVRSWAD